MCLGSYDDAQRTMETFGMNSVVGAETVPTTPGIDVKQDMFLSKTVPSSNSRMYSGIKDKHHASSLSKLTTSASYPKTSKHEANSNLQNNAISSGHQRPSYQQPHRPSKSSVCPKVTHLSAGNNSQPSDTVYAKQPSPGSSKHLVKPVTPRPPSRQDNWPKEKKEKTHHHVNKKKLDKERIKLQQEKGQQRPPKFLNRLAPVKTDQPLYEDPQVKRSELNTLNKTLASGRPVMASMPPSKSPHNRIIGKESGNIAVPSGTAVTVKPVSSKVPKPLPSPTVKTPFTGEPLQQSPSNERVDKNAVNASMDISMTSEKKVKEKKLKKKKHKSKTSELIKEAEKPLPPPPPVENFMELNSEPKLQPHVPSKKPAMHKPPSLDLRLFSCCSKK